MQKIRKIRVVFNEDVDNLNYSGDGDLKNFRDRKESIILILRCRKFSNRNSEAQNWKELRGSGEIIEKKAFLFRPMI